MARAEIGRSIKHARHNGGRFEKILKSGSVGVHIVLNSGKFSIGGGTENDVLMRLRASEALIFANKKWIEEGLRPLESAVKPAAKHKDGELRDNDLAEGEISYDRPPQAEPPAKDPCTRRVEHFLCLFYLNTILVPLRRLQTLILAMAGVFVFVLLSYSSYPFESRESFHVLLISVFFVISLVVGIVYGQMYTNPLLSRITSNKPGELGLDFWVRMATFVFVPLLSLLSVQFPEINSFLFSWLQPALQSIK
jgi:hypothetical protein